MDGARRLGRVKKGDRLVIMGRPEKAVVAEVFEEESGSSKIVVDWDQGLGRSRVYEHDQGKVWHKYEDLN